MMMDKDQPAVARRRGSYGVDAPYLLPIPLALATWNLASGLETGSVPSIVAAGVIVLCIGLGFYVSRRGKFIVWGVELGKLGLRGDEYVLDLGCGRGAVLLLAADYLRNGLAVGVDLWRRSDQSGNAALATLDNATAEGVRERVAVATADMMRLPIADESVDVVVSNVAVHNVKGREGREQVMREAVRVLRPGGTLMIADIFGARHYESYLKTLGVVGVRRRGLGWRMWWTGPWMGTQLVSGRKPTR